MNKPPKRVPGTCEWIEGGFPPLEDGEWWCYWPDEKDLEFSSLHWSWSKGMHVLSVRVRDSEDLAWGASEDFDEAWESLKRDLRSVLFDLEAVAKKIKATK